MDAILTDSHLDTRIIICIPMKVIALNKARVCRRSTGKEREVR